MGYVCNSIGGGWFGMMIIPLLIIGFIIYIIIDQTRKNTTKNVKESDYSLEILNERFARGEINETEYTEKKALLSRR